MFCEGIEDEMRRTLSEIFPKHVQKTSKTYQKLVEDYPHFFKFQQNLRQYSDSGLSRNDQYLTDSQKLRFSIC